jgi:hypothetical protein
MTDTQELATTQRSKLDGIGMSTGGGVVLANLGDAWTIATAVKNAQMAPRGLDTPAKVLVALMAGAEVGLPPMATLKYTMVVNNVPTLYGDGPIALVLRSGLMKAQRSGVDGEGDARSAWFECERKDVEGVTRREFSVADAKAANLWGKAGPWKNHPERMLMIRARAFALRDVFADVLGGFRIAEEVQDYGVLETEPPVGSEGLLSALRSPASEPVGPEPTERDAEASGASDAPWGEVEAEVAARDGSLFSEETS